MTILCILPGHLLWTEQDRRGRRRIMAVVMAVRLAGAR